MNPRWRVGKLAVPALPCLVCPALPCPVPTPLTLGGPGAEPWLQSPDRGGLGGPVVGAQRHGHQRERWDVVRQARGGGGEEARRPREAQPVDERRPLKRSRRKWKWWWWWEWRGG
ncbi:hypothetical protein F5882DRAFT_373754 [Hyaloscypha sp. PMI_1271]|nr:hypothetical protein F5882DRAFT_373754 [Hyaloscypha sp. PMI_1271]